MGHRAMTSHHEHTTHLEIAGAALADAEPSRHGDASGGHGGHGAHHGHHVEMFRTRFWWSLLLTVPLVLTSHMVMDWFGYDLDFPGIDWAGQVLGTFVFAWGRSEEQKYELQYLMRNTYAG